MKWVKYLFIFLVVLFFIYQIGPKPQFETFDNSPSATIYDIQLLNQQLADKEAKNTRIKPDNQAMIVWADSIQPTDYAIVYLHGFSGSRKEGDPVHRNIAERYGCNLYLARLPGHGIGGDTIFIDIEPADWVKEAKEAIAVGKTLGKKVILMATSTGATLAAYLAAGDPTIHSMIFFAPNINIFDKNSKRLNGPWGKQLSKIVFPNATREWEATDTIKAFWTNSYHVQGVHALRELVDQTMQPAIFKKITQPVFVSYYYENEEAMDKVISVAAIQEFVQQISTPEDQITNIANTSSKCHAIASGIWNPNWQDVENDVIAFMENTLQLKPALKTPVYVD